MLGQPRVDAAAGSDRLPADRQAEGRRHRHRPRAHRHADAAQEGRRRQVRRVLRPRPLQHDAGRPRHHRQHGPGIRRDLRLLPGRWRDACAISTMSGRDETASRWSRPIPRRRACGATRATRRSGLHRHAGARPLRRSCRRWPARSARKAASRSKAIAAGFAAAMETEYKKARRARRAAYAVEGKDFDLGHGDVVIAAITSCTNTSNPSVLMAAGLLARNAVAKGLKRSPGSRPRWRRDPGRRRISRKGRACRRISTRSASTSSASAAPPASAIPARCRRRSPRPSTTRA